MRIYPHLRTPPKRTKPGTMTIKPPNRKMDWEGLTVVAKYKMANRLGIMPAGTKYIVDRSGIKGLHLTSLPCDCCGLQFTVLTNSLFELQIPDTPENRARMEWNKKRYYEKTQYGRRLVNPPKLEQ